MQKLFLARIEAWILYLVVLLGLLAMVCFGGLVLLIERGSKFGGVVGQAAVAVAEVPLTLREMSKPDRRVYAYAKRFEAIPSGWSFEGGERPSDMDGYLLMSRLDGDRQRHAIELWDLRSWSVRHTWLPNAEELMAGANPKLEGIATENWTVPTFRAVHPIFAEDGGLLIKDHYSPLVGTDACSRRQWMIDNPVFSHSLEPAGDGDVWVPAHISPPTDARWPNSFRDDSLARVTPDGRIAELVPLSEILIKRGKIPLLFPGSNFDEDPLHLNDIQPVPGDGPYWRAGDLFLSLRGPSMVALYRPSTEEIVWMRIGPWLKQHDVDVVDDHRISVFSNNLRNYGTDPRVEDAAEVMIYDFATDEVTSPWKQTFLSYDIETTYEGLSEILPDGRLMVEETNSGRMLIISADGEVEAQFLNRASDGQVYRLGWSRYIERADGDAVVDALKEVECNE